MEYWRFSTKEKPANGERVLIREVYEDLHYAATYSDGSGITDEGFWKKSANSLRKVVGSEGGWWIPYPKDKRDPDATKKI